MSSKNNLKINGFSLAATSYTWPADIETNIEKLTEYVDGAQLNLFELPEESLLPNPFNIKKLIELKEKFGLKYFAHLPLKIDIFDKEKFIRNMSSLINVCENTGVDYYILHINPTKKYPSNQFHKIIDDDELKKIYSAAKIALNELFGLFPFMKTKLLIENINYPPEYIDYFLFDYGLDMCLDIGHLFIFNYDCSIIKKYADKIKLVHLHDLNEAGNDHNALNNIERITAAINNLKIINYKGFIILELFDSQKLLESLNFIRNNFKNF